MVRDMECVAASATGVYLRSIVNAGANVEGPRTGVDTTGWGQWQGRLVLPAGATLSLQSYINPISALVSGYQLAGP